MKGLDKTIHLNLAISFIVNQKISALTFALRRLSNEFHLQFCLQFFNISAPAEHSKRICFSDISRDPSVQWDAVTR